MSFTSDLENERQAGRFKSRLIIGLLFIIGLMSIGWMTAPSDISLHYPPDLRSGATMKVGEIDPSEVYLFAGYILQQLNSWDVDGAKDYPSKVNTLRHYITPRYKQSLKADIAKRMRLGQLRNRIRKFSLVPGTAYREEFIAMLGGSWVVWLDVNITEHVLGEKVKEVQVRYPMRIVRYNQNPEMNPWQLALDGPGSYKPQKLVLTSERSSDNAKGGES